MTDNQRARDYFDSIAAEYNRAFAKESGSGPTAWVNRYFRGKTFARRMAHLSVLFEDLSLRGRSVLDLGCGSGQVSVLAARAGAKVQAVDIAPAMLGIARQAAASAGLLDRLTFTEGDVSTVAYPASDVVLLVGVVEYYKDYARVIANACAAARKTLVIGHTTRVPYRMLLRRILFAIKGSSLYFHPMPDIIRAAESQGLKLTREIKDIAYSILVFERAAN